MKTLIIDPFLRTITKAEHDGSLKDIYEKTHCTTFTMLTLDNYGGALFLDEEGLLTDLTKQAFFTIDTHEGPLAGYAMVIGTNGQGDTTACGYTVEEMTKRVGWATLDEIREQF